MSAVGLPGRTGSPANSCAAAVWMRARSGTEVSFVTAGVERACFPLGEDIRAAVVDAGAEDLPASALAEIVSSVFASLGQVQRRLLGELALSISAPHLDLGAPHGTAGEAKAPLDATWQAVELGAVHHLPAGQSADPLVGASAWSVGGVDASVRVELVDGTGGESAENWADLSAADTAVRSPGTEYSPEEGERLMGWFVDRILSEVNGRDLPVEIVAPEMTLSLPLIAKRVANRLGRGVELRWGSQAYALSICPDDTQLCGG